MTADLHCEASYYNEKLSVWEPLLEPLEDAKTGRLQAWCLSAEVTSYIMPTYVWTVLLIGGVHQTRELSYVVFCVKTNIQ